MGIVCRRAKGLASCFRDDLSRPRDESAPAAPPRLPGLGGSLLCGVHELLEVGDLLLRRRLHAHGRAEVVELLDDGDLALVAVWRGGWVVLRRERGIPLLGRGPFGW